MGDLSYKFSYKVPDQMDNVCDLATALIFTEDISQVIKETYTDNLIGVVDLEDIKATLETMTYKSCKVAISGKDICSKSFLNEFQIVEPLRKDKWFKTTHVVIQKPDKV